MSYATYCPEDDKLRLYVGRVPRDEYERLRSEGWTALHKQRETGGGDFAAVWTPSREDTALEYSPDGIEDEDKGPAERAADRAERFSEYRDKRHDEATGRADLYDAGPSAHGYQSAALAERRAARHDLQATRAVNLWEKAEYWQRRTAGVIAHALHVSAPGVRMGRIKTIEAEQRKNDAERETHRKYYEGWQKVAGMEGADQLIPLDDGGHFNAEKANQAQRLAYILANSGGYRLHLRHPDGGEIDANGVRVHGPYFSGFSAYDFLTNDTYGGGPFRRLTPKEYAEHYLSRASHPDTYGKRWADHYALRLAYENQMLEAQGGRAAHVEMIPGGWIGQHQIYQVNKSPATGRVTSVKVKVARVTDWTYQVRNEPGTDYALMTIETERLPPGVYRTPTDEEMAEYTARRKTEKKAKSAATPKGPALLNPTDAEAERIQSLWNAERKEKNDASQMKRYGKIYTEYKPSTVCRMTQDEYSKLSGGTYSRLETREILRGGNLRPTGNQAYCARIGSGRNIETGPGVCKIRTASSDTDNGPRRVVVLTDKPQKELPAEVWDTEAADLTA